MRTMTQSGRHSKHRSKIRGVLKEKWESKVMHGFRAGPGPARKLSSNVYGIYHCRVYSE